MLVQVTVTIQVDSATAQDYFRRGSDAGAADCLADIVADAAKHSDYLRELSAKVVLYSGRVKK